MSLSLVVGISKTVKTDEVGAYTKNIRALAKQSEETREHCRAQTLAWDHANGRKVVEHREEGGGRGGSTL